jgi:adenylate cyclase
MIRALGAFNSRRARRRSEPIEIGIGLVTGEVLAGSVGPSKRMEYTAIGNNVNLAARLESANKYYGTAVLLAATTVDELKSRAILQRLDLIQAKGTTQPTWVYESLRHHTRRTFPKLASVIKAYKTGVDCQQRRDWTSGLGHFAEALELAPQDRPSRIFFDRCRYYQVSPPDEAWDGVWIMQEMKQTEIIFVVLAKAGTQSSGFADDPEATMRLHPREPTQRDALYRSDKRLGAPHLAASVKRDRRIC